MKINEVFGVNIVSILYNLTKISKRYFLLYFVVCDEINIILLTNLDEMEAISHKSPGLVITLVNTHPLS